MRSENRIRALRRLTVGSATGWVVGAVAGTVGGTVMLVALPDSQPFPLQSVGYWLVVTAISLPAVLATASGGGLLAGWLAEGLLGAGFGWALTSVPPDADYYVYTSLLDRLVDVLLTAGLFAAVLGTGGYLAGRLLLAVRERRSE